MAGALNGTGACHPIPPPETRNSLQQTRDDALEACKARCLAGALRGECSALNVVPVVAPPSALFGGTRTSVPWGNPPFFTSDADCSELRFAAEPAGSSICYGVP